MNLSIVIVNWNSKDYVRKCLQSVAAGCPGETPQIIVVDGASFDGCGEMLAAEFPEAEYVQSDENIGFGRCNNLGIERVRRDTVLFLNPDTEVRNGALTELMLQLARFPNAGMVGARLLNTDGSLQTSCVQSFPTPLNQALDSEVLRRWFPNSKLWGTGEAFATCNPLPVEAVSGACIMMKTDVCRRVGAFSPEYFMYGEDVDLCWKVYKDGLACIFVPGAHIVHHGGGSSTGAFSKSSTLWMRQSIVRFVGRRQGKSGELVYRFSMAISSLVRLSLLVPAVLFAKGERRKRLRGPMSKWAAILRWSFGRGQLRVQ